MFFRQLLLPTPVRSNWVYGLNLARDCKHLCQLSLPQLCGIKWGEMFAPRLELHSVPSLRLALSISASTGWGHCSDLFCQHFRRGNQLHALKQFASRTSFRTDRPKEACCHNPEYATIWVKNCGHYHNFSGERFPDHTAVADLRKWAKWFKGNANKQRISQLSITLFSFTQKDMASLRKQGAQDLHCTLCIRMLAWAMQRFQSVHSQIVAPQNP